MEKLEELKRSVERMSKVPAAEQALKAKQGIVSALKQREDDIRRKREHLQRELRDIQQKAKANTKGEQRSDSAHKAAGTSRINPELIESLTRETKSSAMKKRPKPSPDEARRDQINRSVMVIEKDAKYYYVPNVNALAERNEFLTQRTLLGAALSPEQESAEKEEAKSAANCPRISRVSRELVLRKRKVPFRIAYSHTRNSPNSPLSRNTAGALRRSAQPWNSQYARSTPNRLEG